MAGRPTENVSGFGERLNKRFREDIGRKFRALCLSRNLKSVLMWAHYTRSHSGVVIGLETSSPGFPQGLKSGGFEVHYSTDRSRTKLPLAYYQTPNVETLDLKGNVVNNPNEEVLSDGGLFIPFRDYRRQVEEAGITALTTKAEDWRYEQEIRFLYDLDLHSGALAFANGRHLVTIPPDALREVVVGFRADVSLVRKIVQLYRDEKIGKPKLFYSECHPNRYEVQSCQVSDKYLLDYFEIVLPNM
jgi:hypothetical protein